MCSQLCQAQRIYVHGSITTLTSVLRCCAKMRRSKYSALTATIRFPDNPPIGFQHQKTKRMSISIRKARAKGWLCSKMHCSQAAKCQRWNGVKRRPYSLKPLRNSIVLLGMTIWPYVYRPSRKMLTFVNLVLSTQTTTILRSTVKEQPTLTIASCKMAHVHCKQLSTSACCIPLIQIRRHCGQAII